MSPHLSTLTLHQLRYGELDPQAAARAQAHVQTCERCRRRLAVQQREREAFVLQPVPEPLRARPAPPHPPSWVATFLPALALAAACFVAVPVLRDLGHVEPVEQVRLKGAGPALEVWVERDGGARVLRPEEPLRAGDRIQILFDPQDASHIVLAGRDPTGTVEVWGALTPERPGLQPAPFGLTLDATPGYQEVAVIGAPAPLTEAEVARILDGRQANGVWMRSVMLPKE